MADLQTVRLTLLCRDWFTRNTSYCETHDLPSIVKACQSGTEDDMSEDIVTEVMLSLRLFIPRDRDDAMQAVRTRYAHEEGPLNVS